MSHVWRVHYQVWEVPEKFKGSNSFGLEMDKELNIKEILITTTSRKLSQVATGLLKAVGTEENVTFVDYLGEASAA